MQVVRKPPPPKKKKRKKESGRGTSEITIPHWGHNVFVYISVCIRYKISKTRPIFWKILSIHYLHACIGLFPHSAFVFSLELFTHFYWNKKVLDHCNWILSKCVCVVYISFSAKQFVQYFLFILVFCVLYCTTVKSKTVLYHNVFLLSCDIWKIIFETYYAHVAKIMHNLVTLIFLVNVLLVILFMYWVTFQIHYYVICINTLIYRGKKSFLYD